MANVLALITLDDLTFYRVDADPTTTGGLTGVTVNPGDIILLDDGASGAMWIKSAGSQTSYKTMVDSAFVQDNTGGKGTVIELDFGTVQKGSESFSFTHVGATVGDTVKAELAYLQPTGKSLDEVEMDSFEIMGRVSSTDTITLVIKCTSGTVQNKFKFRYFLIRG